MYTIIGKTYSLETNNLKEYLQKKNISFDYIDLETNKEHAEQYKQWLAANKIITIPVLKKGRFYMCGSNKERIDEFIKKCNYSVK